MSHPTDWRTNEKGSELTQERDEAKELAKKALEKASEMESKQYVSKGQWQRHGLPRIFRSVQDVHKNEWMERQRKRWINWLWAWRKKRVWLCPNSNNKSSYNNMVKALREKIGRCQVPKATINDWWRKVGETLQELSIDIKHLCGEAYPNLNSASFHWCTLDNTCKGCNPL